MSIQPSHGLRDTDTGWDQGWENAVDEGEGFEEYILESGQETLEHISTGRNGRFDHPQLGKNEPEGTYHW